MSAPSRVILLGPQRQKPTVGAVLREIGIDGPIAVVSAGWQEREEEDRELNEHLGRETENLRLYARADLVFEEDQELARSYRERQDLLRRLREVCAIRLSHAIDAARELLDRKGDVRLLGPERLAAVKAVQDIDTWHLERARHIHEEFDRRWTPAGRPAMARHRAEVENIVKRSDVVLVAGGHVAVLLYRMRLFGLADLLQGRTVIGWAAGAMALSERVVLFHDDLPFGPGHAESLDDGLGLARGIVPLPHASRRLRLDDPARVSLFARRFAPAVPVALDPESRVDWNGDRWTSPSGTRRLTKMGDLEMLAS